jgi:hypothetical protein
MMMDDCRKRMRRLTLDAPNPELARLCRDGVLKRCSVLVKPASQLSAVSFTDMHDTDVAAAFGDTLAMTLAM